MSILTIPYGDGTLDDLELIERGVFPLPADATCFYCGRPFQLVAVYWLGDGDLYLHPACVYSLFARLARDVHEIELRTHQRAWELEGGVA